MKNTLETRLGVFFALAVIASVILMELIGGFDFFRGGYRLHALFNNVQELKVGDPVKMAGVQIGKVESVRLDKEALNKVRVTLRIQKDKIVRTDSKAAIKFTGLLGQNFVSVDFGSPQGVAAAPNSVLETVEIADFSTLIAKLDVAASGVQSLTTNFSGESLNNLLGPFTDFLKQNGPQLTTIFDNIKTVTTRLSEGQGTIGRLINDDAMYHSAFGVVSNLQNTTGEFQSTARELRTTATNANSLLATARLTLDQVNEGKGTIGKLVKDETLYNETTAAMTSMRQVLDKVNNGQGSIGKLLNDDSLLRNVKMTLQKVDKATEGLEDQGPLSVLGMAINSLF